MGALVDSFLICGLGSLGQHCASLLKRFTRNETEISIAGVDLGRPEVWEAESGESLLDGGLVLGDCRREEVLEKAGIRGCRTALFVTSTESTNVAAALVARRLNPRVRIVLRSSRERLNELLGSHLENWVALDPTDLPAPAFALAALRDGTLGVFSAGGHSLRVVERVLEEDDPLLGVPVAKLHRDALRVISLKRAGIEPLPHRFSPTTAFFQWEPGAVLQSGDTVALIETAEGEEPEIESRGFIDWEHVRSRLHGLKRDGIVATLGRFQRWVEGGRNRMLAGLGCLLALLLWLAATLLLKSTVPGMTWLKATASGVILMLGGFGDVFGGLQDDPVPWWVLAACLLITLTSILFILGAFGLIAEGILSARLDVVARSGRLPRSGHFVIVGFGRVGRRVAEFFTRVLKAPVLCLTTDPDSIVRLPRAGFLSGDLIRQLERAHLSRARGLVAVTDDEVLNLEAALVARSLGKHGAVPLGLSIRVFDPEFGKCLDDLLPGVRAESAYALSAEAFVSAAFGENILSLFKLNGQTVLVAEFRVVEGDTLAGTSLGDIAYGFGAIPVHHFTSSPGGAAGKLLPSDETRVEPGDVLILLASLNALRRIEANERMEKQTWELGGESSLAPGSVQGAASILRNLAGVSLPEAKAFVQGLPGTLTLKLHEYTAFRLLRSLSPFGIAVKRVEPPGR